MISMKRFLTATGSGAPPEMQDLTDLRLNLATSGWLMTAMYIVGTPQKLVTFSFSIVFITSLTSKRGSRTTRAPTKKGAFIAVVIP